MKGGGAADDISMKEGEVRRLWPARLALPNSPQVHEMLADVLLDMHNVHHYHAFMAEVRRSIQVSEWTARRGGGGTRKLWDVPGQREWDGSEREVGRQGDGGLLSSRRLSFNTFVMISIHPNSGRHI